MTYAQHHANASDRDNYRGFDLVRLLAALGVVFSHSFATIGQLANEPIWRVVPGIFNAATASVGCFFAISGFLVTRSFLARATSARGVASFVLARVLRIFPAFIVCLIASTLLGAIVTTLTSQAYWSSPQTWDYLWQNLTLRRVNELPGVFTSNVHGRGINGSIWTIPLEVGMYVATLAFGLLAAWRGRWRAAIVALALVAWCYLAPQTFVFFIQQERNAAYAVLCYAIGTIWAVWNVNQAWTLRAAMALAVAFVVAFVQNVDLDVARLFAFAVVALVALYVGRMQWSWMSQASRFGDLSYGVFLYSSPIQQTLVWAMPGIGLLALLGASSALALVTAFLSWYLIEKRALRLKRSAR
jgi:peptidoglycan/LPS O-acetylase OafA/YrhL